MTDSISVVIATYNGARYVEKQIRSVLLQLRDNDEIIIVDDASSDSTVELVKQLSDCRIRIYKNKKNIGALLTFERALSMASGNLIFLCDQDDIWHPEKVSIFIHVFSSLSDVTLLLSDARVIDAQGLTLSNSFFERRGGFVPGVMQNIIKNRYLGCVMAFRRLLLDKILPFPPNIPQHDMWIGLINGIYGKAYFIPLPLVDYRRHENNASLASSHKRGSVRDMFIWRWALLSRLLIRLYDHWKLRI